MGNNQSIHEFSWLLVSHPVLRNSEILIDKKMIKTNVSVIDEYQIQTWLAGLQKIQTSNCQYLFTPSSYAIASRSMCGTSCTVRLKYENYPYILMEEIINRCKIGRKFQQNQIWYLLYVLTQVANACLSIDGKIGDVRPHNILFNEQGQLKVLHKYTYPGQITNFQKTLLDQQRTFLSPQQMRLIFSHKNFNNTNFQISQSFSIGVTLLCAFFLEDMSYLYDLNEMTINQNELFRKISQLPELQYFDEERDLLICYSSQLITITSRLLQIKPEQRLSSIDLQKWLKPFSKQIINFQTFQFKITEKAYSMSGYISHNKTKTRVLKYTPSEVKEQHSFSNAPDDFQSEQKIPENNPIMKKNITRKFTINQQIMPFYAVQKNSKSNKNIQKDIEAKSKKVHSNNNIFFQYQSKDPISEQMSINSQNINNKINETGHFGNANNVNVSNIQKNVYENFASPNKIIEMKRKEANQENYSEHVLRAEDLEDYQQQSSIPILKRNLSNQQNIPIKNSMNYQNMEQAAKSTNSATPQITILNQNRQKSQFNLQDTLSHKSSKTKFNNLSPHMKDDQLLWKLDEQLRKSKKLFPI